MVSLREHDMKLHTKEDPYSLQCSPGVPPVLNWKNLAPVDWSGLPRLRDPTAESFRFKKKWEDEREALGLDMRIPSIPQLPYSEHIHKVLKEMRKECELPLVRLVDWRGINRIAEDAMAEYYQLSRKYCIKMRGTGAATPSVGQGFFPNVKQNGYPQRELERAADYLGFKEAQKRSWAIGPKAKPWRGLGDDDWRWLEKKYPGQYWMYHIQDRFLRWHLNRRAEYAYDLASVRIRKSQKKDHPRPSWNKFMQEEWYRQEYLAKKANTPIDEETDHVILDEQMRLAEQREALDALYASGELGAE